MCTFSRAILLIDNSDISHGLNCVAGYTYGHELDNGSLSRSGFLPQNSRNPNAEYASGDLFSREWRNWP